MDTVSAVLAGKKPQLTMRARSELDDRTIGFIEARDTFFLASATADGGPYVQHRGGPPGFLRAVDRHTLAFADFSGNRQYLTVDNVADDPRVMLLILDFATRRRLKVWGRARVVHDVTSELTPTLAAAGFQDVERLFVIDVDAFDWNCPQHITPRFTAEEWGAR
ncbi:MAG: pyridoxamine 5'-phosphate oxidase family protein [Myxococcota bacterium]